MKWIATNQASRVYMSLKNGVGGEWRERWRDCPGLNTGVTT